jgi:hypothetical protein
MSRGSHRRRRRSLFAAVGVGLCLLVLPSAAVLAVPERSRPRSTESMTPRPPSQPTGRLVVVKGKAPASGPGSPVRFIVEVEEGLPVESTRFAAAVQQVLYDDRSLGGGSVPFRLVDSEPAAFRVVLASPDTTDRL